MGKRLYKNLADRILSQLAVHDAGSGLGDCWCWTGSVDRKGYGLITLRVGEPGATRPQGFRVHRVAWELFTGKKLPTEGDYTLDHLCWVRSCCRVEHLEVVTRVENTMRRNLRPRATTSDLVVA